MLFLNPVSRRMEALLLFDGGIILKVIMNAYFYPSTATDLL
jgi:hypothetical protein